MKIARAIYWMLVGVWLASLAVIAIEAKREEGGSMPLAAPFGVAILLGGLVVFLFLHVLIRLIWKEKKDA